MCLEVNRHVTQVQNLNLFEKCNFGHYDMQDFFFLRSVHVKLLLNKEKKVNYFENGIEITADIMNLYQYDSVIYR